MRYLADKLNDWVEDRITAWRERLRGWVASALLSGVERTFAFFEPEWIDDVRTTLEQMRDNPEIPLELKSVLDRMLTPGGKAPIPAIVWVIIALFGGMAGAQLGPSFKKIGYFVSRKAQDYRLDPLSVITAWRRDAETYNKYFDDLKDQGWSDDRIEALKFFTEFYPTPQDLVTWLAREVFEPEMIDRYGLDDEAPLDQLGLFEKAGVNKDQMINYWRAHWEHASFGQVVEMLHRGILTLGKTPPEPPTTPEGWTKRDAEGQEAIYDWYRLIEIPPFWRDRLTAMTWNVPTRVDVRRWWDMRTIDEAELYNIYHRQGYHGDDLDNYVRWTKVYTDFPMMMARWKNGWISERDVRDWLGGLEIPEDRIDQFIEEKTKPEQPARVEKERDLTKSEIVKGVKKDVISPGEGIELLMDMGYSEDEADYILAINVAAEAGSPETYEEFKDLTQKWRRATGMKAKAVSEELKKAADAVVMATKEVESIKAAIDEEEKGLIEAEVLPKEATAKVDELRVALHRAEAELARVQGEYDRLKAEFKYTE